MKNTRASALKARFLKVVPDVQPTEEPVVVMKRGVPVVEVIPAESKEQDLFGFMAGEFVIVGDVESPLLHLKQGKVLKK